MTPPGTLPGGRPACRRHREAATLLRGRPATLLRGLFPRLVPAANFLAFAAISGVQGSRSGIVCWLLLMVACFSAVTWLRYVLSAWLLLGGGRLVAMMAGSETGFGPAGQFPEISPLLVGGTICLSLVSVALLFSRQAQAVFWRDSGCAGSQAAAFGLGWSLLTIAAAKARIPLLLADRFLPGAGKVQILLLAAYAALLPPLLLNPSSAVTTRTRIWRLFSLVFFGQLLFGLLGWEKMLMTGTLHLPVPAVIVGGPIYRGTGFFMPVLYIVTLALAGGAWCSYLCYFGAADDFMSRRKAIPGPLPPWLRHGRVATLFLVGGTAYLMRSQGISGTLAATTGAVFGLVGLGIISTASSRHGIMVHCLSYCPIGFLTNLLGRLNPFRIRISRDCDACGACSRACRYHALTRTDLEKKRPGFTCTLCGDCLGSCSRGRLFQSFPAMSPETSRKFFVILVVALHTLFLGVARI